MYLQIGRKKKHESSDDDDFDVSISDSSDSEPQKKGNSSHFNQPCKFGKRCTRGPNCKFQHDDDDDDRNSSNTHNQPCKFGKRCTRRPNCKFQHDDDDDDDHDSSPRMRQFKQAMGLIQPSNQFGFSCRNNFQIARPTYPLHQGFQNKICGPAKFQPNRPRQIELCKFGTNCTRDECTFLHPEGKKPKQQGPAPCRWGAQCTNRQCPYPHPPNRPERFNPNAPNTNNSNQKPSTSYSKPQIQQNRPTNFTNDNKYQNHDPYQKTTSYQNQSPIQINRGTNTRDKILCLGCWDQEVTHVVLPCAHFNYCKKCSFMLKSNKGYCLVCDGSVKDADSYINWQNKVPSKEDTIYREKEETKFNKNKNGTSIGSSDEMCRNCSFKKGEFIFKPCGDGNYCFDCANKFKKEGSQCPICFETFNSIDKMKIINRIIGANDNCQFCHKKPKEYTVMPCGHNNYCRDCAEKAMIEIMVCFVCEEKIKNVVKTSLNKKH